MAAQHSDPLSPTLQLQLERADRAQRDEFVAGLARRMRDVPLPARHVRTTIRPLAWKIYVAGIACTCVVTVYSITPRPRSHSTERYWFASIEEARAKFPQAQLLDDPPSVQPRLQDKGPENTDNLPDCKFCGNASRLIVDLEMDSPATAPRLKSQSRPGHRAAFLGVKVREGESVERYDSQVEIFVRFQDGRAIVSTFLEGRMVERELYNQHGEIAVIPSQP